MIAVFPIFLLLTSAIADSDELWCVAKNNADDSALQSALDWACGPGGADCSPIQQGGACYSPADLQSHASFAFNDYFVKHGFDLSACNFSGTAAPISLNPSHDKCKFPSSTSAKNGNFSGSSTRSNNGLSTDGDDMSGASTLQLNNWMTILTLSLSVVILSTSGSVFNNFTVCNFTKNESCSLWVIISGGRTVISADMMAM